MEFIIDTIVSNFGGPRGIVTDLENSITRVVAKMPTPEPMPSEPTTPEAPYPRVPTRRTILPPPATSWPFSRQPSTAGGNEPPSQTPLRITLPRNMNRYKLNLPPSPVANEPLFDSMTLINAVKDDFIKNINGFIKKTVVNKLFTTASFKPLIDKELNGIKVQIDLLQANPIFRDLYNTSAADRQERIVIMLIDAILKAKVIIENKVGQDLTAEWRKKHPKSSFGGSRRKTRKAKRKIYKRSMSRYNK